jgi:hypothetical protein
MEELVAELVSAFLCADLNLTPQIREYHAAYIANWLEVLKNVCSGQGNNCVNAFVIDAAETAQLQDIFSSSLRVGFTASFSNATDGPDRLFLANSRDVGLVGVPAPVIGRGTLVVLAVGVMMLGFSRRRFPRRRVEHSR